LGRPLGSRNKPKAVPSAWKDLGVDEPGDLPLDPAAWHPFSAPGAMAFYERRCQDLFDQYGITDDKKLPHYQVIIRRIATLETHMVMQDMSGVLQTNYSGLGSLLQKLVDQLMKFNEVANVQNNLRDAQRFQEKLLRAIRETLCPECLAKLRQSIKMDP
jgi:hypothetical protein